MIQWLAEAISIGSVKEECGALELESEAQRAVGRPLVVYRAKNDETKPKL